MNYQLIKNRKSFKDLSESRTSDGLNGHDRPWPIPNSWPCHINKRFCLLTQSIQQVRVINNFRIKLHKIDEIVHANWLLYAVDMWKPLLLETNDYSLFVRQQIEWRFQNTFLTVLIFQLVFFKIFGGLILWI